MDALVSRPLVAAVEANGAQPIRGTLGHAGFSRNGRLYFPEHFARADGIRIPIHVNHGTTSGIENELHLLPHEFQAALREGRQVQVGEATLKYHPHDLRLDYQGTVTDPFFAKEVRRGRMNVSLGLRYDPSGPAVCDEGCYTPTRGAQWDEMSLVYHPGMPTASLAAEAKEAAKGAHLRKRAMPPPYNQKSDPRGRMSATAARTRGAPASYGRRSAAGRRTAPAGRQQLRQPQAPPQYTQGQAEAVEQFQNQAVAAESARQNAIIAQQAAEAARLAAAGRHAAPSRRAPPRGQGQAANVASYEVMAELVANPGGRLVIAREDNQYHVIPAQEMVGGIDRPASGASPATASCGEGQLMDAKGECITPMGDGTISPDPPPKVKALTTVTEAEDEDEDEDDDKDDKDDDDKDDKADEALNRYLSDIAAIGSAVADSRNGGPNADKRTILRATRAAHERYQKAQRRQENERKMQAYEAHMKRREMLLRKYAIEAKIRAVKAAAQPQFKLQSAAAAAAGETAGAAAAGAAGAKAGYDYRMHVLAPAGWLKRVVARENAPQENIWGFDKQTFFESYPKRYLRGFGERSQQEVIGRLPPVLRKGTESVATAIESGMVSATEAVTGPPGMAAGASDQDVMRVMSEQVFVDPNGKVVTPIRQWCEVAILPPGVKDSFAYRIGDISFDEVKEENNTLAKRLSGNAADAVLQEQEVEATSVKGTPKPRGKMVTLGYSYLEEAPVDAIAALNRAYALESVNDENTEALTRTFNDDTGDSGDKDTRTAKGGGTKSNWVRGDTGAAIAADANAATFGTLKYAGLIRAKTAIRNRGIDVSNVICYVTPNMIADITLDPDLDSYISFSMPEIITEGTVERIAGVNLVQASQLPFAGTAGADQTTGKVDGYRRAMMFVPDVALMLTTGRDLTMEAQRRIELQSVLFGGTHKVTCNVKVEKAMCRLTCKG